MIGPPYHVHGVTLPSSAVYIFSFLQLCRDIGAIFREAELFLLVFPQYQGPSP